MKIKFTLCCFLLVYTIISHAQTTHSIIKTSDIDITFPTAFTDNDILVVSGSDLEATDWSILRDATKAYHLVLKTGNTEIPEEAFHKDEYNTSLLSIHAEHIINIGEAAFASCKSLISFFLPKVENVGASAFSQCSSLPEISLPSSTDIGEGAFSYCTLLSAVSLPIVESIGRGTFENCVSLSSIVLPAVTNIGITAFHSCVSLSSVSLPAVTRIGPAAFSGCLVLQVVELPTQPPYMGTGLYSAGHPLLVLAPDISQYGNLVEIPLQAGTKSVVKDIIMPSILLLAPGDELRLESGLDVMSGIGNMQWYKDGSPIVGEFGSPDYLKSNITMDDAGLYTLQFAYDLNETGQIEDNEIFRLADIRVVVGIDPSIDGATSGNACAGNPFNENWIIDGTPEIKVILSGILPMGMSFEYDELSRNISLSGVPTQGGTYNLSITVNNDFNFYSGSVVSLDYTLSINPAIITQPQDDIYGNALSVVATGENLTYQWYESGVTIDGANSNIYMPNSIGTYYVAISSGICVLRSNIVEIAPRPLTITANLGQSKKQGEPDPLLTYTLTSGDLLSNDALDGALIREDGELVGTYQIKQGTLTAGDNYTITFISADFTIMSATALNDFNISVIKIYPNPATEFVTITGIEAPTTIRIINITGKVVRAIVVTSTEIYIDITDLSKGIYFVQLELQGKVQTVKMVKE